MMLPACIGLAQGGYLKGDKFEKTSLKLFYTFSSSRVRRLIPTYYPPLLIMRLYLHHKLKYNIGIQLLSRFCD